jgi:hypothetical protein
VALIRAGDGFVYINLATKIIHIKSSNRSGIITPESRLGAALVVLHRGRIMEAMRTHGLARITAHAIFFKCY